MAMNDENPSNVCSESVKEVFICYETTTGLDYAKHVKESLKKINQSAFVAPEDIGTDEPWRKVVDGIIEACKYFVVIITDLSISSEEVKRELELASSLPSLKGNIIPCKEKSVDRSRLSKLPIIHEFQQIDFESKEELARKLISELNKREPAKITSESAPLSIYKSKSTDLKSNMSSISAYVESIKNNDFFRYITNPMVSRSIPLESLYVKLAISGTVHDPEHRLAVPDWAAGQEYQLFTERRYLEKVKEEMDPEKAVEKWQRIVVLGDPGSGKTTLLKYLTLEAAYGRLKGELVPFFITLGEYADPRNKATSLIEFACEQYRKRSPLDDEEFEEFVLMVRDMNERRKALFLLDGFDEIPHDRKLGVSGDIERELNRYVLSSRQFGYTGGVLNDKTLEVVELSDPAIQEFIRNWMRSQGGLDHEKRAESLIDHIQIPRLKMLARNPLLLSVQCIVYQNIVESGTGVEMPTRRVDLYKASVIGLLKTLERRGITNHDVDSLDRKISVNSVFADIAFHYFEEVENAPRHIFGKEELNKFLRSISGKLDDHYTELLSEVVFRSEILHPLTMHEYHFLHLTFQEYYTAYHLANQEDGIQTIAERKRDPHWREVIPLYAGMESERFQELIDRIWNNGGDEDIFYNDLFLIGRCLAEVDLEIAEIKSHDIEEIKNQIFELSLRGELGIWREGSNEVLSHIYYQFEDIDDKIRENMKDEDSFVRWCAAGALGKIGGGKAFERLIPLLKDEDPHVRNRAVEALGTVGDKRAVEHLIPLLKVEDGDHDSCWRAAAALEAIMGRKIFKHRVLSMKDEYYYYEMPIAPGAHEKIWDGEAFEQLMQQVKDENSYITMGATITLREIEGMKAFEQLMPLLKEENSNIRGSAVGVLGVIGDTRAFEQLMPLLKDENSNVRRSAARALGTIGDTRAAKHLIPLLKDDDPLVRSNAAISLGTIGDAKDVEHLIPLLKDENSNVRSNAARALGTIGDAKYVEHLIPLLKDDDPLVRRYAADTLGMISAKNNLYIPLSRYKNL